MSLNIVIIGIFFAVLLVIALLYRNSTLDKLPLLTGEKILFEEGRVRVEQGGSSRSVIFINCIVRLTNMRIVIAQKMLLSGKYALRHVVLYTRTADSISLGSALKKGYLSFAVTETDLKVIEEDERCIITIEIPASALTKNQFIRYRTSGKEYYNAITAPVQNADPGTKIV